MTYILPSDEPVWPGDILFFKPLTNKSSWLSRLTAWVTASPVSHVELAIHGGQMLGGHTTGIHRGPVNRPAFIARFPGNTPLGHAFAWAFRQEGAQYDFLSALSIVLRRLGVSLSLSQRGAVTCSEFIARFLEFVPDERVQAKLAEFDGLETVTPGDLLRMFQKLDLEASIMEALQHTD